MKPEVFGLLVRMNGSISILILGYSRLVLKRILPALQVSTLCNSIEIATKSNSHGVILGGKVRAVYDSYDKAIDSSESNFVYISLPNSLHDEYIIKCALKGFNLIIDKPAILSYSSIEYLKKIRSVTNIYISESVFFQYHPVLTKTLDILGGSNNIQFVSSQFTIPALHTSDFRLQKSLGGGVLLDMSAYLMGLGRFIWNMNPKKIHVSSVENDENGLVTSISASIDYDHGRIVQCYFAFNSEYRNNAILYSKLGIVEIKRVFSAPPQYHSLFTLNRSNSSEYIDIGYHDSFLIYFETFINDFINNEMRDGWFKKLCDSYNDLKLLINETNNKKND